MTNEIKIRDGRLDEFFQKSIKEQRYLYFYKKDYDYDDIVRLTDTEKNVIISRVETDIVFSGNHFFRKSKETGKFIYNKKEAKVKCNTFSKANILNALTLFPQFDWLKAENNRGFLSDILFCDSIVRDILIGKLTNVEAIVKKYLALNKIKGVNWKAFAVYTSQIYSYRQCPIAWMQSHTTDTNAALMVMISGQVEIGEIKPTPEQEEKSNLFYDMLKEAMALNVKINPKWSLNRMKEEHKKMTEELMKKDLESKEQVNLYGESPHFDYPCKLLSTDSEVFMEGFEMHHCVYTCYWNRIKEHEYLTFAFYTPERFTLGLNLKDGEWVYDQAYLKYDKQISEESKALVDKFLGDSKVKETLKGLIKFPAETRYSNVTDDDEWLRGVLGYRAA